MLTADLVPVQRRGDTLQVRAIPQAQRDRLLVAARAFVEILAGHQGRSHRELEQLWDDIESDPMDFKLLKGLRKLLEDRSTFEIPEGLDAPALRRAVFSTAARHRRELPEDHALDVGLVLAQAAPDFAGREGSRESWLFGDLHEHQILTKFDPIDAVTLVTTYEWALKQAVLLRAVQVTVVLHARETEGLRRLFRQLRFRRLLYTIQRRDEGGYTIQIDGPFSLFQSVTSYGLGLALLLPTLDLCGPWSLDAQVRWEKGKRLHSYHLEGKQSTTGDEGPGLPEDLVTLVTRVGKASRGWTASPAEEILDLPGLGLCIPDLVFRHPKSRDPFYLEVMGYWSRDAVWKRVELVEAGLPHHILFAVSSRLRVSEKVLDGELPGQLYVYKGTMIAGEILDRLDAMRDGTYAALRSSRVK